MNLQLSKLLRSVNTKNYGFTEKGQIKNKHSNDEINRLLAEDITEEFIVENSELSGQDDD